MKLLSLLLLASVAALTANACRTPDAPHVTNATTAHSPQRRASGTAITTPDEFTPSRTTYRQVCANCHRDDGRGGIFELEGERLQVPNLGSEAARNHSDERLIEQITKGGGGMPAFGQRLDEERIRGLVRFIRHEFQGQAGAGTK